MILVRVHENAELAFLGMMKAGPFDIEASVTQVMLSVSLNPNALPNSDVVRRRIGGQGITGRSREGWIIDFGVKTPKNEAALYEVPFEYVRKRVLS